MLCTNALLVPGCSTAAIYLSQMLIGPVAIFNLHSFKFYFFSPRVPFNVSHLLFMATVYSSKFFFFCDPRPSSN